MTAPILYKDRFKQVYIESLVQTAKDHPDEYFWATNPEIIQKVASRMFGAMDNGTFNHDSRAYRLAAKKLKIKANRASILEFWHNPSYKIF